MVEMISTPKPRNAPNRELRDPETPKRSIDRGSSGEIFGSATFAALVASIRRCTEVRGDSDANREALIAEAADLTPREQQDMREHFDSEAERWSAR